MAAPAQKDLRVMSEINPRNADAAHQKELGRRKSDSDTLQEVGSERRRPHAAALEKKPTEKQQQHYPKHARGSVFAAVIKEVKEDVDALTQAIWQTLGLSPSTSSASQHAGWKEGSPNKEQIDSEDKLGQSDGESSQVIGSIPSEVEKGGRGKQEQVSGHVPMEGAGKVELEYEGAKQSLRIPSPASSVDAGDAESIFALRKKLMALEAGADKLEGVEHNEAKQQVQKVVVKLHDLEQAVEAARVVPKAEEQEGFGPKGA